MDQPKRGSETSTRNLRVLHVIESLGVAGAEQSLVNLLPRLPGQGVDCEVAALWSPYDLALSLREHGIAVHELNISSRWQFARGAVELRHIIRKGEFDLVHAHLPGAVFYASMARGHTPAIASFHGLSFELYPANTLLGRLRRRAERWWTNHRMLAYIAVSSTVAEHYHRVLGVPLERIRVIANGFPTQKLRPNPSLDVRELRQRFGVDPDDFLIVSAGRFVAQKGHIYLLSALSLLKERGLTPKVLLFGRGGLQSALEQRVKELGLSQQISLRSAITQQNLLHLLQASDAFVFPSISEGFGMAAGEAMCMGLPVIATDLPGIATLIKNEVSGILVAPGDPEALANQIERVLSDSELRRKLSIAGRERIVAHFSLEKVTAQVAEFYRELVIAS